MKVLFVNSANKKKRISPFILSQATSLQENGIELDFFSLDQGGLTGYIKHAFKLRRTLRIKNYDIIHAHYALMGFISSFARKKEKLVVSLMGCDILGSYRSDGSLIWADHLIVVAAKFFARYSWDLVILKSANMVPKLLKKTKYEVIPNGVELSVFSVMNKTECRSQLNLKPHIQYILFPTNPERIEKNFPLAQAAFEIVKNELGPKVELIVVYKLTYDELVVYYNAVDVCIMTSRSEGSPNVIKECMACNLPIVSTDVGDVKDIIADTEGCFICESDPKIFAKGILAALRFNKPTDGRNKIKHLEINKVANKIISKYQFLINRG
jgi:teichuronic acid biosynthesis glycosyltransferase TuaC